MPSAALRQRMMESMSGDGLSLTYEEWMINHRVVDGAIAHFFGFPDEYEVTCRPPGVAWSRTVTVVARSVADLKPMLAKAYPAPLPNPGGAPEISAELVRYHRPGAPIGEEGGGSWTCNDASLMTTLPVTCLRGRVPQRTLAAAVTGFPKGRGVMPDHVVEPDIADLRSGRDVVMEYTLRGMDQREGK